MWNVVYIGLVLIVALLAIAGGFRKGLTRQLASLLGFAFGAVASRVLTPEITESFFPVASRVVEPDYQEFAANLLCGVSVYAVVYALFSILSPLLNGAMSVIETGMFNRIAGAFFSLLKNLLWLSIIFNIFICLNSTSGLLEFEKANDGNLVAAVMDLTPAVIGCYGAEDFAHFHQLKEAKRISCNFKGDNDVIITKEKKHLRC